MVPANFSFSSYVAQYTIQRLIFENLLSAYSRTPYMEKFFSDRNIKIEYEKKKTLGTNFRFRSLIENYGEKRFGSAKKGRNITLNDPTHFLSRVQTLNFRAKYQKLRPNIFKNGWKKSYLKKKILATVYPVREKALLRFSITVPFRERQKSPDSVIIIRLGWFLVHIVF